MEKQQVIVAEEGGGGIKVEVWKEYDVLTEDDLDFAIKESEGRPFRAYGKNRSCYYDLDCKNDVIFAYMFVTFKERPNYGANLAELTRVMMSYMNSRNMTYDHAPVCASSEPIMRPFRERMYQMFPNVKRVKW